MLLAALGTWIGFPILDPIIGMLIGLTIVFITWDATKTMWYRLMDAVEPAYVDMAEEVVQKVTQVKALNRLRMRWMGHRLHAEVYIAVDPHLTTDDGHVIAEKVRHELFHEVPNLSEIVVHVDPWSEALEVVHEETLHHEPVPRPITAV